MKKLFLSALAVALAGSAYAVPNSFSDGDIVSAEEMNANFQHLEQQFQGTQQALAKKVNCAAGEKIGKAIDDGYTNITVSGTCTENLLFFEEWGDNTFALAPRYLKLTGADSTAKLVDASGGSENTIFVGAGTTLSIENLTISGGSYGLAAYRNSNLLLSGVTIENFTNRGISVSDSSYLGVNDGGVTISGGSGAQRGIHLGTGSSGWVHTSNISNVERGVNLFSNSFLYLYNFTIEASNTGINIGESQVMKINDGVGVIEGTSDRAVDVARGNFYSWGPGSLTIQNLNGGLGISLESGISRIHNLKMPDFNNTGNGGDPALEIYENSSFRLEGAEITGSTDGPMIGIYDSSVVKIQNSTITATSASNGLELGGSSRLQFRNSTISGSVTDNLVGVYEGSSAKIEDSSTLTITSAGQGLRVSESSQLIFKDSTISGTVTDGGLVNVGEGSSAVIRDSTISGTVTNSLVSVDAGSSAVVRDATLTLDSGEQAVEVTDSSDLTIRNSKISGAPTSQLIRVTRVSNATIRNETTLSQTGSDTPDVSVSNLSFLSVYNEEATINKVDCYSKGYVSANEGIVTDLATSCTE